MASLQSFWRALSARVSAMRTSIGDLIERLRGHAATPPPTAPPPPTTPPTTPLPPPATAMIPNRRFLSDETEWARKIYFLAITYLPSVFVVWGISALPGNGPPWVLAMAVEVLVWFAVVRQFQRRNWGLVLPPTNTSAILEQWNVYRATLRTLPDAPWYKRIHCFGWPFERLRVVRPDEPGDGKYIIDHKDQRRDYPEQTYRVLADDDPRSQHGFRIDPQAWFRVTDEVRVAYGVEDHEATIKDLLLGELRAKMIGVSSMDAQGDDWQRRVADEIAVTIQAAVDELGIEMIRVAFPTAQPIDTIIAAQDAITVARLTVKSQTEAGKAAAALAAETSVGEATAITNKGTAEAGVIASKGEAAGKAEQALLHARAEGFKEIRDETGADGNAILAALTAERAFAAGDTKIVNIGGAEQLLEAIIPNLRGGKKGTGPSSSPAAGTPPASPPASGGTATPPPSTPPTP